MLKVTHTSKAPPASPLVWGCPFCHGGCLGGVHTISSSVVYVAVGLSTLSCCRESRASRDPSDAKVSTALRWVYTSSSLPFEIFRPLCSPRPFPALSPGRNGSSWLARPPGPQGTSVRTCTEG